MYLGLDLGTTNVKALVVEPKGRIASIGAAPVERHYTDDGGVEQDIDRIWRAVRIAVRKAVRQVDSTKILAVGISSQGGRCKSSTGTTSLAAGSSVGWIRGDSRMTQH